MTSLINDLNDLVEQFEREKISKKVLLDTLLNIVSHERKSKAILFTHKNYEAVILKKDEFDFLYNWLSEDLHLAIKEDTINEASKLILKSIIERNEKGFLALFVLSVYSN
jgi:hypothetical protein